MRLAQKADRDGIEGERLAQTVAERVAALRYLGAGELRRDLREAQIGPQIGHEHRRARLRQLLAQGLRERIDGPAFEPGFGDHRLAALDHAPAKPARYA